jgi:hypothetical protein
MWKACEVNPICREEIIKRIGRSPDWASAYILARIDTPSLAAVQAIVGRDQPRRAYDPYGHLNR